MTHSSIILDAVLRWLALVLLSCIVPLGIFVGRNNIRAFRRELVRDLGRLFSFAKLADGNQLIIPSFELVKYNSRPAPTECLPGRGGLAICHAAFSAS